MIILECDINENALFCMICNKKTRYQKELYNNDT